jgi:two-component system response regulator
MTNSGLPYFANSKGLKILLVEDNPDDEILTMEVFKNFSMQGDVSVVRDGQEALDYLFYQGDYASRALGWEPDLIIMDLKIPKVTGIEVIKRIRANPLTQLIPIVIFSSSSEERDLIDGYMAGANSYIRKPIDYKKFSQAIHQILNYWLQLNEIPLKHNGGKP